MEGRLSMATRQELIAAVRARYAGASRRERAKLLDELVAVAGYHRKHAIRALGSKASEDAAERRRSQPRYDEAIRKAVIALWEASDRVCGKRLKPLVPVLLPALERHGAITLTPEQRELALAVSPATIDRLLAEVRARSSGCSRRRAGFTSAVRRSVPVRTFADWQDPPPGYLEGDLVAHCGESAEGNFVQTLVLTDIATGWTECLPLVVREGALVIDALERARTLFPFPLQGVDFDNDTVFMNEAVVGWCRKAGLEITRSRAYRKNDQAWVEQKNGAVVRRLVGYARFEGLAATAELARLYAAARWHVNVFQASFKLKEKTREGARVRKRYHAPVTPLARVLDHPAVEPAGKAALRAATAELDPVLLLGTIRAAQAALGERINRRARVAQEPRPAPEAGAFAASLAVAWKAGEVRPTHRRPGRRRKPWAQGRRPFDGVREEVRGWLLDDPSLLATEILARLQERYPGQFPAAQKRTLQREVKAWRADAATRLILQGATALGVPVSEPMEVAAPLRGSQERQACLGNIAG
jgi:hypothetical protein